MFKSYPFSINLLGYASIGMMACAIALTTLAIGLPYWERSEVTLGDLVTITNQGLWTYCINFSPETTYTDSCGTYGEIAGSDETAMNATRALAFIGLVLGIAALVMAVLATFPFKTNNRIHFICAGLGTASGVFLMLTMVVFVARTKMSDYDVDVCVSLVIIGWLAAWVSAGYILFAFSVKYQADN
ncbi:claudin-5-like [Mya arenaria]|uniref:claudin-5-like n=1 Tax=Mya arenaria TaxID=6604 RepID=UPI0022E757D3|nr:claudin-5-like [Mya arenaria]